MRGVGQLDSLLKADAHNDGRQVAIFYHYPG